MNKRSLGLLGGLTLVMLLIVLLTGRDGVRTVPDDRGAPLLPALKTALGSLADIEIIGDSRRRLSRENGVWVAVDRHGYPVDQTRLGDWLRTLADMKTVQRKTANPDHHDALGLGEDAAKVILANAERRWELLVGNAPAGRDGQYVRLVDDPQTWLVDQRIATDTAPARWLLPIIVNVEAEQVRKVTLAGPDSAAVVITQSEAISNAELVSLPVGRELKYPGVADQVVRALVNVRLVDVGRRDTIDWQDAATARFELADGTGLTVELVMVDDVPWLALVPDPQMSPEARAAIDLPMDAERWMYQVESYDYAPLVQELEDFLAPLTMAGAHSSASSATGEPDDLSQ